MKLSKFSTFHARFLVLIFKLPGRYYTIGGVYTLHVGKDVKVGIQNDKKFMVCGVVRLTLRVFSLVVKQAKVKKKG